ncbi:ribbon-helix-helix protein, CopG family [Neglectibacter timonensis]|nr:ribbon-helix-helix protein, CopG family [Neglectibacter timonensis]MEE0729185.1 ribbon-helix-helix protein, CopG family [Oscillospiraceae bacterium]
MRIDDKTNEKLIRYADKYGVTRTEAIRRAIDLLLSEEK